MIEKKLLVIIPCYNESKNILTTINNLKNACNFDYLVINDASTDKTQELLEKENINFISHSKNKGLSEAIRTGIKYALDNNYDYVIQIDGDNQHNPNDISSFLEKATDEDVIIIGNRYKGESPKNSLKTLAQKYISFWFKIKTKIRLFDPTNGMRLYGKKFMKKYVENTNLMVEPSSIAYLIKKDKLRIVQVHTDVKNRIYGESMYNNHWKQLKYVLRESTRMFPGNTRWATKKTKGK